MLLLRRGRDALRIQRQRGLEVWSEGSVELQWSPDLCQDTDLALHVPRRDQLPNLTGKEFSCSGAEK